MATKVTQPGPARPQPVPPTSDATPTHKNPAPARDGKNHPADVHQKGAVG